MARGARGVGSLLGHRLLLLQHLQLVRDSPGRVRTQLQGQARSSSCGAYSVCAACAALYTGRDKPRLQHAALL
jgi:hypothetical protein